MTSSSLADLHGVGPTAVKTLSEEGITSIEELREALQELKPGAGAIYSSFQLDVLERLELPTAGAQHLSQYTRRLDEETELTYVWETDAERYVLSLSREGDRFRTRWTSSTNRPDRMNIYESRSQAEAALTRWAYRPPETGLSSA